MVCNGAKSTAIKRMQTVHGSLLWFFILFDFILNIPVNKFSVMSAHLTKFKMRGSREGVAEGPDPLPGKSETFGSLAILVQIPWKIKGYQASIILGNYLPASVLLLG